MPQRRPLFVLFALFVVGSLVSPPTSGLRLDARLAAAEPLGVRVPEGFEVTLFADDDLAHDILSLTIDSFGRVVVSGPGYVRILLDRDGDGRADAYKQYVSGPKTGAQGMCFDGRDLICTGDDGLIRYTDRDGDDLADGPPPTLLSIKAGGEHHAHSVQRGPDGWWYVMAGNMAGVTEKTVTLPTSPVLRPRAGTLLRLKPDFSGCEVVAHGFRNAYDFAFNAQGDIFTYDSDGEREVSLPWYRPTRVFHVLPGSDAGWVSETWKHPDYYPDMPPVLASLGRGSPTGVLCYRHEQFPAEYRGALFVADWTFGRIVALPLVRDGETWKTTPKDFMTGSGSFGFAPTDMEVGPDGSMYVSVGGRGTRGGVYRVRASPKASGKRQLPGDGGKRPMTKAEELTACLSAHQPLSSWSYADWFPLARNVGPIALQDAALDGKRPVAERIRAIELLSHLFSGLDESAGEQLAHDSSPEVRARAVSALRRSIAQSPNMDLLITILRDADPLVVRVALETLLWTNPGQDFLPLDDAIRQKLSTRSRFVRQMAISASGRVRPHHVRVSRPDIGESTKVRESLARARNVPVPNRLALVYGPSVVAYRGSSAWERLDALRLLQMGLGDVGKGHLAAFDGYDARSMPTEYLNEVGDALEKLAKAFPTNDALVDLESLAVLCHACAERRGVARSYAQEDWRRVKSER